MRARQPLSGLLIAVSVLLVLAGLLSGCAFPEDRVRVSAEFPDSVGLYVGNNVAVLGIPVGTVTAVRPEGTHVVVEMELNPEVRIPADVGAVTLSPSVVTDRRVELTPVYRGGPQLRDGDRIPLERTRTPVEIDRVFAAADRLAKQLNTALDRGGKPALADALDVTAREFAGNGPKLRESLRGLAAAVGVGADNRDQLVALIRNVDHLTRVSADNDATVRSVTANLAEATVLIDQQGPRLTDTLDNLADLLDRTDRLISENRADGEGTLRNLRTTAATVAERRRELAESIDLLPTLFVNLFRIVDVERKEARVHVSMEQPILDTQLVADLCRRYAPAVCSGVQAANASGSGGLAALLLGAGR